MENNRGCLLDKKSSIKGFTLIELLAVIVILAIIALITVPLILNVIETAKRGSFKDTAYGLIESAELYYSKQQLNGNNLSSKTFTFPDAKDLGYKGENPKSGNLVINQRGQVALAISNDKYCITKGYNETEVTVSENLEKCITYKDASGANSPDLLSNMIPVKYNGTNWVYADSSDGWYDYDKKQWANAVVLNTGVTKNVGDTISESDVALWYVWVPRYKYQLFNAKNELKLEQEIAIRFESGTETTGTATCQTASNGVETCTNAENGNWYTHPAFTLGTQQLTGIWVGKFEVSTSDGTCNSSASYKEAVPNCNKELPVTIKPGISSWRHTRVVNFFNSIQKMSNTYSITDGDSHMMKNIEWGAVAYLKQSKYGLGMTDIGINSNTSYVTGGGTGTAYKTEVNVKQSTTGNIHGVYDMSGGADEYVMGMMVDSSGEFSPQAYGFTTALESKYYDIYSYDSSNETYARGHLGDATRETLQTTGGWYTDYAYFLNQFGPWFKRGGRYEISARAGVFNFYAGTSNGDFYDCFSTRAVLTRK